MKKVKLSLLAVLFILFAGTVSPVKSSAQVSVSFQVFYDDLAPYGNWVTYPGYGYVWMPHAEAGFRPYLSGGHWVYSDEGWVWASNYNWGWAPFHYGSWLYDPYYGWLWVPGYSWAPAWVTWGNYDGYYGWAPVGPGFSVSVGYYPPISHWCFMEPRYMVMNDWGNHYYVAQNNQIIINNTTIINNERRISSVTNTGSYGGRAYYSGPRREEVERTAHTTIQPASFRESSQPSRTQQSGNALTIYRPRVQAESKSSAKPSRVTPVENARSSQDAGRTGGQQLQRSNEINKPSQRNSTGNPVGMQSGSSNQSRNTGQATEHATRNSEMNAPANRGNANQQNHQMNQAAPAERQTQHHTPGSVQQKQVTPADKQMQRTPAPVEQRQTAPAERPKQAAPQQHQQEQHMSSPPAQRQQQGMNSPAERKQSQPHASAPAERQQPHNNGGQHNQGMRSQPQPASHEMAPQQRQQAQPQAPRQEAPAEHESNGRPKGFR